MLARPLRTLLVCLFAACISGALYSSYREGVDHGPVVQGHIGAAETFIEEKLKRNGAFDRQAIDDFIAELKKERLQLQKDLRETTKIEMLELDLKKYKKVKKKAK